jgi:hypothetical protein
LICPGGGYERLSHIYNGFNLAHWYNSIGISAFVLIPYRMHNAPCVSFAPMLLHGISKLTRSG